MSSRKLPAYQLHKATKQAKVRIDGKDYYLGLWGSLESKAKYDKLISDWLAGNIKEKTNQPEAQPTLPALTVSALLNAYLDYAEGYYRKRGKATGQVDRIERAVKVAVERCGSTAAIAFGPRMLKEVRRDMVRLDWTRAFINSCIGCLVRAVKWAVSEEMLPGDAAHALEAVVPLRVGEERVREGRSGPKPVPWSQVEATLKYVRPAVADLLRVLHLGGMRPIEACWLRACDIRFDGSLPDGTKFPGVWVYVVPDDANKNAHRGKPRYVFLGPKAQAILSPYIAFCGAEDFLFSPKRSRDAFEAERHEKRQTPNWPSAQKRKEKLRQKNPRRKPGERYPTRALQTAIRRACEKAGVPLWSANQLRHSRATQLNAMADLGTAGAVLGHASLETAKRYAAEAVEKAARAMRDVG